MDWFLVSKVFERQCAPGIREGPCPDHWPVYLGVPTWGKIDLGYSFKKPKVIDVKGDSHTSHAEEQVEMDWGEACPNWTQWCQAAEAWLCDKYGCEGRDFRGRGQPVKLTKRNISMPQDEQGEGCSKTLRADIVWVRKARRLAALDHAFRNPFEDKEFGKLLKDLGGVVPALDEILWREDELREKVWRKKSERLKKWRLWMKDTWKHEPRKVFLLA